MPAELSVERHRESMASFDLAIRARIAMILLGYVPLVHVVTCCIISAGIYRSYGLSWSCLAGAASLYLLPPLAVVAVRPCARLRESQYQVGSQEFFCWWYTTQWQVVFNRIPMLEEMLRMIPGVYSMWLRLWGAKIGGLVYWSPGLILYDRPFFDIGSRVIIGANTKLIPHYLARGKTGATELVLARITIGADALIGGSSLLPAGVRVAECEQTPGGRPMAPFSRFENGRHIRTTRINQETMDD